MEDGLLAVPLFLLLLLYSDGHFDRILRIDDLVVGLAGGLAGGSSGRCCSCG